jgi:hypothetical protein
MKVHPLPSSFDMNGGLAKATGSAIRYFKIFLFFQKEKNI